jgi:murein peptide amidase A
VIAAAATLLASASLIFGHSVRDRALEAQAQGFPADRTVLVVGSIHGNEGEGHRVVRRLRHRYADRLDGVHLWTIKTVNPDGVAAGTRGNAHSVDLNRNFATDWKPIPPSSGYYSGPKPFSEPETKAVRRFLRAIRPDVTIWYHQPFGRTLIPCDRRGRRVALRYARLSGLPPDDCFPTPPGAATGWQDAKLHEKAFVVEFGPGRLSRGEVRRHARAVAEIAEPG